MTFHFVAREENTNLVQSTVSDGLYLLLNPFLSSNYDHHECLNNLKYNFKLHTAYLAALSFCNLRRSSCCCLSCFPRLSIWCSWWSWNCSSDWGPVCWLSKLHIVTRAFISSSCIWCDISSTLSRSTWIDAYRFSSPPCQKYQSKVTKS